MNKRDKITKTGEKASWKKWLLSWMQRKDGSQDFQTIESSENEVNNLNFIF